MEGEWISTIACRGEFESGSCGSNGFLATTAWSHRSAKPVSAGVGAVGQPVVHDAGGGRCSSLAGIVSPAGRAGPRADRPQAGPPCGPPCAAFEPASRSVPSGGKFRHWPSRGWRRRGDRLEQDASGSYATSSTLIRGASSTMWASRDRRQSLDGRSVASRVNLVPHQDQQCCPGAPPWRFATAPARPAPVRHGEKLWQLAGEGVTRPGSESIGQVARPGGRMAVRVMSGGRLHYQVWLDGARITHV